MILSWLVVVGRLAVLAAGRFAFGQHSLWAVTRDRPYICGGQGIGLLAGAASVQCSFMPLIEFFLIDDLLLRVIMVVDAALLTQRGVRSVFTLFTAA